MLLLAGFHIRPAPLHHQRVKKCVVGQHFFRFQFVDFRQQLNLLFLLADDQPLEFLFHLPEVPRQRMNSQGRAFEVVGLPLREQLDHVLEIE